MTTAAHPSRAFELVRGRERVVHERLLAVSGDLTDEQLSWRPAPGAHSIGFTLWHCARSDDNVQMDLSGDPLIWEQGDRARRWGHPERGVGTGWDDERAAALPLPPRSELFEYARAVFDAVDRAAAALDEGRLAETIRSRFSGGKDALLGEVLIRSLDHDNRHLGEIEYIKGLLGLRGSATI